MRREWPEPPAPEEQQALIERVAQGDKAARAELIERNLLLAKYGALRFKNTGIEYEERFSLACLGLIYAVDHYEAGRGAKFSTYASWCMENRIIRAIRARKAKKRAEVALSLDTPIEALGRFEGSATLGDLIAAPEPGPDAVLEEQAERAALRAALAKLPEDTRRYLALRFGGETQTTAGRAMGWSPVKANKREHAAFKKCRARLARKGFL